VPTFEGREVPNLDAAAADFDGPLCLEFAADHRHRCTLNAENAGKAALRHGKRIITGAVLCLQKPSAHALADVVYGIAGKHLLRLLQQAIGVAHDHVAEGRAPGRRFGKAGDGNLRR
jgi:hypothetical protein